MHDKQWEMFYRQAQALFVRSHESRLFSGCVIGALDQGEERVLAFGTDDYEESGLPMEPSRLFDLASLTKVFPTSTLALKAIARGELDLHAPVARYLPEFAAHHDESAQVFHLLTHSLDYRFPMSSLKDLSPTELFGRICAHPFAAPPGSLFNYGNAASLLLGRLLEELRQKSLEEQAREEIFEPLGLKDAGWYPLHRGLDPRRLVPTEHCPWRDRVLRGEVHDESAYALGYAAGSAGMFATAGEVLRFASHVLQSPELLSLLCKNALPHLPGVCTGLGWELANTRFMGTKAGPRAFGKTGFTGSSLVCDPDQGKALVLLCNFTWPRREANPDRIYALRSELADLFFGIG